MNDWTLILIVVGLFLAWVFGPVVVLDYRRRFVPMRLEEIVARFSASNPGELLAPSDNRSKSGAWHYARLLNPGKEPPHDPGQVIRHQFLRFQGWDRYWTPLLVIVLASGLLMVFTGLWLAERLDRPNGAPSAQTAAGAAGDAGRRTAPEGGKPAAPADSPAAGDKASVLSRIPAPFVMALWGAYVWSLYEILGRRRSGDLTPAELYDVAFRYLSAVPLGYAASLVTLDTVPSLVAFGISALPLRDIQLYFRKNALSKASEDPKFGSAAKGYIRDAMVGLGNGTLARLEELNIETWLDLAYADPIKLLIKTGAPIEVVLSWIDQAMVSVYAAPHKATLTNYGMPCALDICEFYARNCWDVARNDYRPGWATNPDVVALATKLEIPPEFLVRQVLRCIFEDPHTQFLVRVWYGPAQTQSVL